MLKRAVVVVLAFAGIAVPAQAQEVAPWEVGMTEDGRARFGVLPAPPEHDVTVHRCPGGGACGAALTYEPLGRYDTTRWIDSRAVRAGDVLEVRWAHRGTLVKTRRTAVWRGIPQRRSRPTIAGTLADGQTVQAAPGTWSDAGWAPGWDRDWRNGSSSMLIACRSAAGTGCERVGIGQSLTLDPLMVGRYLFAETELFFWSGQVAGVVLGPIKDLEPPGPLLGRSRPAGPITGPVAVDLREKATRHGKRLTLGRVRCARTCRVDLTVKDGKGHFARRQLRRTGPIAVRDRFADRPLLVELRVDGRQTLSRVITR